MTHTSSAWGPDSFSSESAHGPQTQGLRRGFLVACGVWAVAREAWVLGVARCAALFTSHTVCKGSQIQRFIEPAGGARGPVRRPPGPAARGLSGLCRGGRGGGGSRYRRVS